MILDYQRPGIPDYTKSDLSYDDERPARWLLVPALLGGLLFLQYGSHWFTSTTCHHAPTDAARTDISMLSNALDLYKADVGQYPTDAVGLNALHAAQPPAAGWRGPYIRRHVPNDAWGHPYVYRATQPSGTNPYTLLSRGPDGVEGTADDVVNK